MYFYKLGGGGVQRGACGVFLGFCLFIFVVFPLNFFFFFFFFLTMSGLLMINVIKNDTRNGNVTQKRCATKYGYCHVTG